MKILIFSVASLTMVLGCTLEPDITVEVPEGAVEHSTVINVDWPDWPDTAAYFLKQIEQEAPCEFNELPSSDEGDVAKCSSNCCLWIYHDADMCVEQWCLNLENSCGWELTDWNCLENV